MILQDFHIHTNYCDGKNSPEEMVEAALEIGMQRMGFTCHLYTDFDESYCIKKARIKEYVEEIYALKEKYKNHIEIFCGTEMDYFSIEDTTPFDYVIGSVHYVKKCGKYLDIDLSPEQFISNVQEYYAGDYIGFCVDYFNNVTALADAPRLDIIGHFDLVTKFNEGNKLFDTSDARYISAARSAVDKLVACGKPFEINTGAITRGYRSEAYPELSVLEYIYKQGGTVILSSDSHSKDTLCAEFEKYKKIANDIGFKI